MKSLAECTTDIRIAGFTDRERTLFASLFKVSDMRANTYREWQADRKPRPDCLLLDLDLLDDATAAALHAEHSRQCPIVTVGARAAAGLEGVAHISRPVRWAEVLVTLDTVFNVPAVEETAPAPQAEQLINAENELELEQLQPWYDRSETRVFRTTPAILLIDPDPDTLEDIRFELSGSGYRVDHVRSAAAGLLLLSRDRYNCVIMEPQLPGEDGYEVCRRLKQSQDRRRTATIILTASRNPVERVRGAMAGCDVYLSKPVNPAKLVRALEKFLPDWKMG